MITDEQSKMYEFFCAKRVNTCVYIVLFKPLIQPSYVQQIFLKTCLKVPSNYITLHVSASIGHHQVFKIVDEDSCASV
jgi:hypothetical protein